MMIPATRYIVALALTVAACRAFSQCDTVDAYVEVGASDSEYYSAAVAVCYLNGTYGYAFISITHTINEGTSGSGSMLYFNSWETTGSEAQDTTHWFGDGGECFYTEGDFWISHVDMWPVYHDGTASACACIPQPVEPPPEPITLCDDGSNTGDCSPIVISLGQYSLSGADDPVLFDMNADGSQDRLTWTARGSSVAFLALDRDQNGRIDNGSELFGNWTMLASGAHAANGFVALEELDTNGDGVVSVLDARWSELLLWTDTNHDAVSQSGEMMRIEASVIEALGTVHHWTGRRDRSGNVFGYEGLAYTNAGPRFIWDVYFRSVP